MAGALRGIGQAGVGEAQQRSVPLLDQVDLDQARPRWHHLTAVPAEAVSQAMHRHDLAEGATRKASAGDVDEIKPAGLRLELRLRPHPAQDLLGIGQQGENRGGRCRDVRLAADDQGVFHWSPPRLQCLPRLRRRRDGPRPSAAHPRVGRRGMRGHSRLGRDDPAVVAHAKRNSAGSRTMGVTSVARFE